VDRTQSLVPRLRHTDDRDNPLSFKLQQGSEERQERRRHFRWRIEDFRL